MNTTLTPIASLLTALVMVIATTFAADVEAAAHASASPGASGPVGKVLFVRGVATAHQEGQNTRILGRNAEVFEGDILSTSSTGYAIVETVDQGRVTLRPNTVMALDKFRYRPQAKPEQNTAVLRLFKGGLRAVTGLVTKRNPERGMSVVSPVATLGIRGTEFDTRICAEDCAKEAGKGDTTKQSRPRVVGRLAFARGKVEVHDAAGATRRVVTGGALFRGDEVETDPAAMAVVVFRDNTRVTVRPGTRFKVTSFRYRDKRPDLNNVLLRVARGGLRVLTGLVAKADNKKFSIETPVATVGVRGTNFDVRCEGDCAAGGGQATYLDAARTLTRALDFFVRPAFAQAPFNFNSNLAVYTRQGETNLQLPGRQPFPIPAGRVGALPVGGGTPVPRLLPSVPPAFTNDPNTPPESVRPRIRQRFGTADRTPEPEQGSQFTTVYSGNVEQRRGNEPPVHIGTGESALTDPGGRSARLPRIPTFTLNDPIPSPNRYDAETGKILPKPKSRQGQFESNDENACRP
ncbi:MAG: FecR family protein [Gammaproteobacteria bacterium]